MKIGTLAIALACAIPMVGPAGREPTLRIYGETGAPLATIVVKDGFTLSFIHSVNLSPVDEEFIVDGDGRLRLVRMSFDQMSTGMPSGDEDGFHIEDGRFVTVPDRTFSDLAVRVSPVPGHVLSANGWTRALTDWAPVGGLLVFRAAPPFASPVIALKQRK